MEFKSFRNKLVAVLNKRIENGRAMNALAHMALGLGGSVANKEELRLQDYADADEGKHPNISDIPFIVLRGSSGQIRNLRKTAIENDFQFTDFTDTMIGETYVEQHKNTQKSKEEDLEYFGICIFGDWDKISELTKKFSLWK
ncbi:MAG TPA: DUF2000 domain-containing protein [Candidatus Nanoarchaeia archaeon]|nr:DUF2000 domain-containing protein [Candidatus Nanoarchaeia archaeon]